MGGSGGRGPADRLLLMSGGVCVSVCVCECVYIHVAETDRVVTLMSAAVGLYGGSECPLLSPPPSSRVVWACWAEPPEPGGVWVGGHKQRGALESSSCGHRWPCRRRGGGQALPKMLVGLEHLGGPLARGCVFPQSLRKKVEVHS